MLLLPKVFTGQSSPCDLVPKGLRQKPRSEWRGRYVNEVYWYSVSIPENLTGYDVAPPAPLHGFGIALGDSPQSYIFVDGASNSLEFDAPIDAALRELEYSRKRGKKIESATISGSHLGGLDAILLSMQYSCPGSNEVYAQASTFALSPDRNRIYEITLYSLLNRYDRDRKVLNQILKSWKFTGK